VLSLETLKKLSPSALVEGRSCHSPYIQKLVPRIKSTSFPLHLSPCSLYSLFFFIFSWFESPIHTTLHPFEWRSQDFKKFKLPKGSIARAPDFKTTKTLFHKVSSRALIATMFEHKLPLSHIQDLTSLDHGLIVN
jgi:hypothetical protein